MRDPWHTQEPRTFSGMSRCPGLVSHPCSGCHSWEASGLHMRLVILAGQAYCLKSVEWSHWQERECQGRSAGVTCLRVTHGPQPPYPFSSLDHPGERKLR